MGSYFLSHLHALGGGVVGYLMSLSVRPEPCRVLPRVRALPGRALVRRADFGVFHRFRSRTGRLQRSPRHALENRRDSARRLREVLRRRKCRAAFRTRARLAAMDAERTGAELLLPARAQARGHRRGRPDGEFRFGHRDFCRRLHALRQADHERAGRLRFSPTAPRPPRDFSPATWSSRSTASRSTDFAEMQRIVSESAGETLRNQRGPQRRSSTCSRRRRRSRRSRTISATSIASGFSASAVRWRPEDLKFQPVSPPQAVWMGVQETWFVIDRTLSYIGGVIVGREAADQLGGPIRIAQMSGQVATHRLCRADPSCRRAFGLDRASQSLSDPAARWRSPFVLFDRGHARPAAVGKGPGGGVSHRSRDRRHVDDICNFQ